MFIAISEKYDGVLDIKGVKCFDCNTSLKTYSIKPNFPVYGANKVFNNRGTYYYPEEPGPRVLILDRNKKVLLNTYANEQLSRKIEGILEFLTSNEADTELKTRLLNDQF